MTVPVALGSALAANVAIGVVGRFIYEEATGVQLLVGLLLLAAFAVLGVYATVKLFETLAGGVEVVAETLGV